MKNLFELLIESLIGNQDGKNNNKIKKILNLSKECESDLDLDAATIDKSAEVDVWGKLTTKHNDSYSIISYAISEYCHIDAIAALIKHGFDPNVGAQSPLSLLVKRIDKMPSETLTLAKKLLEANVFPDAKNGNTALYDLAAKKINSDNEKIFETVLFFATALLNAGADLSLRGNFYQPATLVQISKNIQETPLHAAVRNENLEFIYLLLVFGANIDALDFENKKPIDLTYNTDIKNVIGAFIHFKAAICYLDDDRFYEDKDILPIKANIQLMNALIKSKNTVIRLLGDYADLYKMDPKTAKDNESTSIKNDDKPNSGETSSHQEPSTKSNNEQSSIEVLKKHKFVFANFKPDVFITVLKLINPLMSNPVLGDIELQNLIDTYITPSLLSGYIEGGVLFETVEGKYQFLKNCLNVTEHELQTFRQLQQTAETKSAVENNQPKTFNRFRNFLVVTSSVATQTGEIDQEAMASTSSPRSSISGN